jgi:hypothetical protein
MGEVIDGRGESVIGFIDQLMWFIIGIHGFNANALVLDQAKSRLARSEMQHPQSQDNLNFIFSPPMSSFAHPPPTVFPPAQPDDPNSPILFKDNINLVQTQISTVRSLAHEALNSMYAPSSSLAV